MKCINVSYRTSIVGVTAYLALFILIIPQEVTSQINCPQIPVIYPARPAAFCWPEGTRIKVVINSDPDNRGFTPQQIINIRQALENWNNWNEFNGNCSFVTLDEDE